MTLRLIRPICPFNCFLFRVDSLYHLHLNGGILQIIRSLTDHINGFDFISTLAAVLSFSLFSGLPGSDWEACLSCSDCRRRRKVFEASWKLETLMHSACVVSGKTLFFFCTQDKTGNNSLVIKTGWNSSSIHMYSVMKIQLVISHSLSFIWSKRAHDNWSMWNPSKLALCENMSHPCLSSTERTSFAPQAPLLPYSHSLLHKATRTRQFA